jgi:DNA-binding beta-propeller fold protein YncE
MRNRNPNYLLFIVLSILLVMTCSTPAMSAVQGKYLYNLSNFTGTIPYEEVRIFFDRENNEIYVSNRGQGTVKIFNENGMEVYSFGEDADLGSILDGQVEKDGTILLLSYKMEEGAPKYFIVRCNFRGEPTSETEIKDIPAKFSDFAPNRMVLRNGSLYLADINRMKIVVTDMSGEFKDGYDIVAILELTEQQRADSGFGGFSVDKDGNIFFTIPVFFRAYKLTPDRNITDFGKRGGGPGKFNVISGIVTDDKGYIYVADKLRCVVMIFDKEFKFQSEFGYRGLRPGRLIVPTNVEVDAKGRLYVTQMRKRGISVFKITTSD